MLFFCKYQAILSDSSISRFIPPLPSHSRSLTYILPLFLPRVLCSLFLFYIFPFSSVLLSFYFKYSLLINISKSPSFCHLLYSFPSSLSRVIFFLPSFLQACHYSPFPSLHSSCIHLSTPPQFSFTFSSFFIYWAHLPLNSMSLPFQVLPVCKYLVSVILHHIDSLVHLLPPVSISPSPSVPKHFTSSASSLTSIWKSPSSYPRFLSPSYTLPLLPSIFSLPLFCKFSSLPFFPPFSKHPISSTSL